MTWEQKLKALEAIAPAVNLCMRYPGDWHVGGMRWEIKRGSMLSSPTQRGATPEEAVEMAWKQFTELKPGEYLVLNAYARERRCVRWNGFMWEEVSE